MKFDVRELESVLEKLEKMFNSWNLTINDWVLVDEFAYNLQGYDVIGEEVKTKHIDVLVNKNKWPFKTKESMRTMFWKDEKSYNQYKEFMRETGYKLDILFCDVDDEQEVKTNFILHTLPNSRKIRIKKALEMTSGMYKYTLGRYSEKDVGEKKIKEWKEKYKIILRAAMEKNNTELVKVCKKLIGKM